MHGCLKRRQRKNWRHTNKRPMEYGKMFWVRAGDGSPFTFTVLTQETRIANKGLGITTVVFGIWAAGALKPIFLCW